MVAMQSFALPQHAPFLRTLSANAIGNNPMTTSVARMQTASAALFCYADRAWHEMALVPGQTGRAGHSSGLSGASPDIFPDIY